MLSRTPVVTGTAILSLALALGANTAVFLLLNGVLLRPLPIPEPDQLWALSTTFRDGTKATESFSLQMLEELRERQSVFSDVFAYSGGGLANFEVDGESYAASLDTVDGSYFSVLGIRPVLGRFITPSDVAIRSGESSRVAVVSYRCWQDRFHADPAVLGKTIRVDGAVLVIVGVAPKGFAGLIIDAGAEAMVPIGYIGRTTFRDPATASFEVTGRLRNGVTPKLARAQLSLLWRDILPKVVPAAYGGKERIDFLSRRIELQPASTGHSYLRARLKQPLLVMMALVGVVLLIACVNLANLLLARAAAREREYRIRQALGADRWQLVRSLLLESCLLSVSGAVVGLGVAYFLSKTMLSVLWTGYVPSTVSLVPDWRVLGFTAGLAMGTALLFGVAPAPDLLRRRKGDALQWSSRGLTGGMGRFGKVLVAVQSALCVVLVITAALFALTLQKLRSFDGGFRGDNILLTQLFPQAGREKIPNRTLYFRELAESLGRLPGVAAVSYSYIGPAARMDYKSTVSPSPGDAGTLLAAEDFVGPGLFSLLGLHLLSGRDFRWTDDGGHGPICIVSESLAKRLFPGQSAVGRSIHVGSEVSHEPTEIVGVVSDASLWRLQSIRPMAVYQPLLQEPTYNEALLDIRTTQDPHFLMNAARQLVRAAGYQYPLRMQTLEERSEMMLANERVLAIIATFLASLALLLGAIGLYGVLSNSVTRRTSEMGVRVALGAQSGQVLGLILTEAMGPVSLGVLTGVGLEVLLSRLIEGMLFRVAGQDPTVIAGGCAVLLFVAFAAAYVPALRASTIDPMVALREE